MNEKQSEKLLLKEKLASSVKNNRRYYYICLILWALFFGTALISKDPWVLAGSFIILLGTITFQLTYKIDSGRLEQLEYK
jgi:hypothetical protein